MFNYFEKTTDDKFKRNTTDDSSTECEGGGLNAENLQALDKSNKKISLNDSDDGSAKVS